MIVVGTGYMQPLDDARTTFWEWIPTPTPRLLPPTSTMEENLPSPMNITTTTTNATTAADTNPTATATEEEQQQQTTTTIPEPPQIAP